MLRPSRGSWGEQPGRTERRGSDMLGLKTKVMLIVMQENVHNTLPILLICFHFLSAL